MSTQGVFFKFNLTHGFNVREETEKIFNRFNLGSTVGDGFRRYVKFRKLPRRLQRGKKNLQNSGFSPNYFQNILNDHIASLIQKKHN